MKKKEILFLCIFVVVAVLFTVLVKYVDVQKIGPNGSAVGFSAINNFVHELTSYRETLYKLTKYIGYLPIISLPIYAFLGLMELVKGKSIKKVHKELIILGIFYAIVLAIYVFFEKVVINYRPVLMEGELEASYPSSHTLMAICFCSFAVIINNKLYKNKYTKIINYGMAIFLVGIVIGRLLSGVHWFTDIIGGILIAIPIVYAFYLLVNKKKKRKRKED